MKIFFDMDGTMAEFKKVGKKEWSAPGYSKTLEPIPNVVKTVRFLQNMHMHRGLPVVPYILSSVVSMDYSVEDKQYWLKDNNILIPEEHQIYVPCGSSKAQALLKEAKKRRIILERGDLYIDDFTDNLFDMQEKSIVTPVKMLNGINDTNMRWTGARVSAFSTPEDILETLMGISYINSLAA